MPVSSVRRASISERYFNPQVVLPFGLSIDDVKATLIETHEFVYDLNRMLYRRIGLRIEDVLMAATFSGMLSEFIVRQLSSHSKTLTRNLYHNGHPDLIPINLYPGNAIQYGHVGVEIKHPAMPVVGKVTIQKKYGS
jgi:hypothetical protein